MKTKAIKRKTGAVILSGVIALMATGAKADILATSVLEMTDFLIYGGIAVDGSGGTVLDASDFSSLSYTGSADINGNLGSSTYTDGSTTIPIDLTLQCVGDCGSGSATGVTENGFEILSSALGDPVNNYSIADSYESGAPITGTGLTGSATVSNGSWVGIEYGTTDASANSNNNLNGSFTFAVNNDQTNGIRLDFDARAYLEAYVDTYEIPDAFATAFMEVTFTITADNGTKVLDWSPNGSTGNAEVGTEISDDIDLNETISRVATTTVPLTTGGIHTAGSATTGFFSIQTLALTAGTEYTLSFRINANADGKRVAVSVPEPGMVGMLGLGVLALGFARRRVRNQNVA